MALIRRAVDLLSFLQPRSTRLPRRTVLSLAVVQVLLFFGCFAAAQSDRDLGTYLDMVNRFKAQGDVLELEHYVSTAQPGYLRTNALELLAWQYRKIGDRERALKWANELSSVRPDNALALALLADTEHDLTQTSPGEAGEENRLSMAKRALRRIDQLQAIEGMSGDEFAALKKDLARSLNGAIGYAYFQRNDYVTAREYLRKSVALAPDNAQYIYALAIADLYGNPPEKVEGYRLLAQSVNMNKGTPSGNELASFARQRYLDEGGKSADWDTYLANTPAPTHTSPVIVAEAAPPTTASSSVSTTGGLSGTADSAASRSENENTQGGGTATNSPRSDIATSKTTSPSNVSRKQDEVAVVHRAEQNIEIASAKTPSLPQRPPRKLVPAGAPVSMGILIETAATSRPTRQQVVNALTDMVRHLRQTDEAFVVSFSKEVVFEQDLTNNPGVLEKAMDSIKPTQGTALFDAVAFAAGHLNRVARNGKKVLIVVSDGSNHTNRISPLELSGELNVSGVEIYCIGLGADTGEDQYRLQALAQRTGGRTMFISGGDQFRAATEQVAQALGIPF